MYTLNALFDLSKKDGRLSGDRPGGILNKSLNWLRLTDPEPADPNPPAFDPEGASWSDLGEAGTLLLPGTPDPGRICIRVVPDPNGPPVPAGATLQLVVCFGRPTRAHQPQASPFTDGTGAPSVLTTFVFGPVTRNTSAGWFFPLGKIATKPGNPNLTHRYEFSIGIVVTSGGVTRHYGEDPEMDVGQ